MGSVVTLDSGHLHSLDGVRRTYTRPVCACAFLATRGSFAAVRPFDQPLPSPFATAPSTHGGGVLSVPPLSLDMGTCRPTFSGQASPLDRGLHVPVLDVP